MGYLGFDIVAGKHPALFSCNIGFLFRVVFGLWICFVVSRPVDGLRPLRERARSWGDEVGTSVNYSFGS